MEKGDLQWLHYYQGFPAALGLLMLVPAANLILPLYLAFANWPALKDKNRNSNA